MIVSITRRVLSCIILLALSLVLTASISGDSAAVAESVAVVVVVSLLLLQAAITTAIDKTENIFFISLLLV